MTLNISPRLNDFIIAYTLIKHKLQLYRKTIRDTLEEGSEETGAHLVNQLEFKSLDKEEIIELYKNENIGEETAEKHFNDLDKVKTEEINNIKKDHSSAGYLMVAIGIILVVISAIIGNGRPIIWAVFAFIIGIRTIINSNKIK
ncbi:MAG: SdpI family protein [Leptospiraceae bacterium]|nr:SdpI family protein [Leptospiraceae bacterium]